MPGACILQHPGGHRLQFSPERSRGRVEGLRHQHSTSYKQKKPTAINRIRSRLNQLALLAAIDRCVEHRIRLIFAVYIEIKKMLPIGKQKGPAVRSGLSWVNLRYESWSSSRGAHAPNGRLRLGGEQDCAIRAPCA